MRQTTPTEVTVNDINFYIHPFSAFRSSNIFGKLTKTLAPIIGGLVAIIESATSENFQIADPRTGEVATAQRDDFDLNSVIPHITNSLGQVDGDALELLLMQLLVNENNVAFEDPESGRTVWLNKDRANEIFCQNFDGMILLAVEVVKVNYSGFFDRIAGLFGSATETLNNIHRTSMENSEPSTSATSS